MSGLSKQQQRVRFSVSSSETMPHTFFSDSELDQELQMKITCHHWVQIQYWTSSGQMIINP